MSWAKRVSATVAGNVYHDSAAGEVPVEDRWLVAMQVRQTGSDIQALVKANDEKGRAPEGRIPGAGAGSRRVSVLSPAEARAGCTPAVPP